jgi:type I restriction enzyme, S subunit
MNRPKLRFPEFQGAEEWEEKILSNLSACGLSNGIFNDPKKVGTGYKLINVSDMYIESTINEEILSLIEISKDEFSKNKVENGDIFFTRSSLVKSGIAYSNIYLGHSSDITFDGHLIRFRPNKKIVTPIFINYLLKTAHVRKQLVARGKTATMTTIGQSDVGGVNLSIPYIDEQQKIADCLFSLDDRITAETQKLDTLKAHKKGLIQQLFPAEGENQPKLRFPEFRDTEEWEEKKLSQLFEFRNGLNADKERYGKGHKYISVMDVISGKPITYNSIIDSVEITKKELASFIVEYGDILFQRSSETQEEAGQANVYLDKERPAIFGGFVIRGKKILEYIPLFMNALLASMRVRREISSHSAGSTRYNVSQETLSVIVVLVPGLKEQQKIADCLSSLDDLITAQTQKIDTLKTHKKGLMQQLFPALDEVKA